MANYCPECGVNIDGNFKFCPNCGINLTGVKKEVSKPEKKAKNFSSQKAKNQNQKNHNHPNQNQPKTLDTKTTLIIILGALLLAAIILILSGQFNSPESTVATNINSSSENSTQSPNSSV